jgi:ankyrin repeat protein/tRNA A-37 threonylcarbamoyl transferase component Bud32
MFFSNRRKQIGQYEILAEIGQGAFGKVFKGRDVHLERVVAIKELQLDSPSALRDEARVLSELRHENIVGFRQFFPDGNRWYLVMDFIEGGSLSEWIRGRKLYAGDYKSSLNRICSIAAQTADGLAHAHKHGVIHQDVKPANIMVTVSEIAKVTDFGLANAKAVSKSTHSLEQDVTVTLGGLTPAYCSPEQAAKQRLNVKTDVWSWGLSVLEMFAGSLFWRVGTQAQVALDHFAEGPPDRYAVGEMPSSVFGLLQKCFDSNPEGRPSLIEGASLLKSHAVISGPMRPSGTSLGLNQNRLMAPVVRDTALHDAAAKGDAEKVRECLQMRYPINGKDEHGGFPLHYAVNKGHDEVVRLLVWEGADINAKGQNGWSSLHYAANKGRLEIVRYLVSKGADVNAVAERGVTPLSIALSKGRRDVAEFLEAQCAAAIVTNQDRSAKAAVRDTAFHDAAAKGDVEKIRECLRNGYPINGNDRNGETPLHYAVNKGHDEVVHLLVEQGADINAKGSNGWSPLHFAAEKRRLEMVRYLVSKGARVNAMAEDGVTPVSIALSMGGGEVYEFLKASAQRTK